MSTNTFATVEIPRFSLRGRDPYQTKTDPTECECGEPKSEDIDSCERCARMEGETIGEYKVLDALRRSGGGYFSYVEIAAKAEVHVDRARAIVKRLLARGLLLRQQTHRGLSLYALRE